MITAASSIGSLLRQWRQRRALSQLALAADAEISQRHLSFIESGRSTPSRDMVVRLAEQLDVPLRERNRLLLAAGFAPAYRERAPDDPEFAAAQRAVRLILKGHVDQAREATVPLEAGERRGGARARRRCVRRRR